MASRIAAVLPIKEEALRLYQPLILPLAISALGLLGILQSVFEMWSSCDRVRSN